MKFNKYLAMCFLASSLMCGSFTSCGDDDDDDAKKESVLNDKTTAEQGREDGKNFGTIAAKGSNITVTEATNLISLATKYKSNKENTVYQAAFAEGAAETGLLGDSSTGDNAVEKLNAIIDQITTISNGSTTDKVTAIVEILNRFGGNNSSAN